MHATFVPVSGFLGAGKTTTLLAAARELRARGHRPAIVTNDQGRDLVDTQLARTVIDAVGEVLEGCFCCRFEDLTAVVSGLVAAGADVVLAEAVGSCTDLRATVVRPLRAHHGASLTVAPLTTVVDPLRYRTFAREWSAGSDTAYLYAHQLAEADVLAVNKTDLLMSRGLVTDIARRNPSATVVPYSARSGEVGTLVDLWLAGAVPDRVDEALDYDRYAAAEAALAWLNHEVTVTGPVNPARWARVALATLSRTCATAGALVGHAKLSLTSADGLTKCSLTAAGNAPSMDLPGPPAADAARAVFNLRVAWPPAALDEACVAATAAANESCGTTSTATPLPASFQPSYPRPTHRLKSQETQVGRTMAVSDKPPTR